jgi:predicted dehydrogenase
MVKVAIIGMGNMGTAHAENVFGNKVQGLDLTCVCDVSHKRLDYAKGKFGDKVKLFSTS